MTYTAFRCISLHYFLQILTVYLRYGTIFSIQRQFSTGRCWNCFRAGCGERGRIHSEYGGGVDLNPEIV